MAILRVLPLYATAILLAGALALIADARGWDGLEIVLAGAVLTLAYLAGVVVPWLIREYGRPRSGKRHSVHLGGFAVDSENGASFAIEEARRTRASDSVLHAEPLELVHH